MFIKESKSRKLFLVLNAGLIGILTLICLFPLWNILCMSFSSAEYVKAGMVKMWPLGWSLEAYRFVMNNERFWTSLLVSIRRVALGVPVNLILIFLSAYPLSKPAETFPARKYYSGFFILTMLFNGGLIPTYITVSKLGLVDSIWALILPGAVPVFSVVMLMNFFRGLPKELEESAILDGAGQFTVMLRLFLPLSMPAIATVTLFSFVGHWNAWFDGLIYINFQNRYPLQSYLQTVINSTVTQIIQTADLDYFVDRMKVNDRNLRAAQLFISILPIMMVYPFLQKHFTTGLVMGSVKG